MLRKENAGLNACKARKIMSKLNIRGEILNFSPVQSKNVNGNSWIATDYLESSTLEERFIPLSPFWSRSLFTRHGRLFGDFCANLHHRLS